MSEYGNVGPIILAHRGGSGEALENSLAAFQQAVAQGCDYLETDARVGPDGKLYCWHDDIVDSELNYLEMDKLFAAFPSKYFALDPKHEAALIPLARLIAEHDLQQQVCIGASVDDRASRVADLVKDMTGTRPATALVGAEGYFGLLLGWPSLSGLRESRQAAFIHIHHSLINRWTVKRAHKQGLKIITWSLNDPNKMRKFLEWGVDGFMTDYPSRAQEFLAT